MMSIVAKRIIVAHRQAWQYVSILTSGRMVNLLKVMAGYTHSRLFSSVTSWGNPYAVSIEPGTACNLRCPECPTGNGSLGRNGGIMPLLTFQRILEHLPNDVFHLNLYLQGEPLLHPQLKEMVALARERKMVTTISTNAQLMTPLLAEALVRSGLSHLIVSLDGLTQATYETYRVGGSLNKVMQAIEHIQQAKKQLGQKRPIVEVQFIVFAHNEHEVEGAKKLITHPGIDRVSIKTAQLYDTPSGINHPTQPRLSRYVTIDGRRVMQGRHQNRCFKIWHSMVIAWNGTALPCCYDKNGDFPLGNVNHNEAREIWQSKKLTAFRHKVVSGKGLPDMCHNCPEARR